MTSKEKTAIRQELEGRLVVFHKDGTFTVKSSYFYRIGRDENTLAAQVKKALPDVVLVDKGDHYHAFVGGAKAGSKQDSYFWARFKMPEKVENVEQM